MAMHKEDDDHEHTKPTPPSWEVLYLLGPYMEPKTLAVSCCVSAMWSQCFSSENLWKLKQTAHERFNFAAAVETTKRISYKRLISNLESAAKRSRKNMPAKPKISLSDLVFTIYLSNGLKEATVVKKGKDLVFNSQERFEIEADFSKSGFVAGMKEVRMVWQVMYGDYDNIFTIVDFTKSLVNSNSGWFTKELLAPENSYLGGSSNLVGDVKPCFNGEVLEIVGFGIVNSITWGSLFLDDVLRYFQCFLVDS